MATKRAITSEARRIGVHWGPLGFIEAHWGSLGHRGVLIRMPMRVRAHLERLEEEAEDGKSDGHH